MVGESADTQMPAHVQLAHACHRNSSVRGHSAPLGEGTIQLESKLRICKQLVIPFLDITTPM